MSVSIDFLRDAATQLEANLHNLPERDREFAQSLLGSFQRTGGLSEKQAYWFDKLARRATGTPGGEDDRPRIELNGERIVAYFDRAAGAGLQYPKMKLTADGEPLVLARAGHRSARPGSINVTDGGPYGDNVWYGRIERDGTFTLSHRATEPVIKVLTALTADPAKVAALYGQRTGNCCFCRRDLEDYRSVTVGYGPVCAEKWGLPWGEVAEGLSEHREEPVA